MCAAAAGSGAASRTHLSEPALPKLSPPCFRLFAQLGKFGAPEAGPAAGGPGYRYPWRRGRASRCGCRPAPQHRRAPAVTVMCSTASPNRHCRAWCLCWMKGAREGSVLGTRPRRGSPRTPVSPKTTSSALRSASHYSKNHRGSRTLTLKMRCAAAGVGAGFRAHRSPWGAATEPSAPVTTNPPSNRLRQRYCGGELRPYRRRLSGSRNRHR